MGVLSCQSCKEELDYTTQSNREENYTKAFIHQFGLIDPNHDWGFGRAKSRAVDVNGNEWVAPPTVSAKEIELVFEYLSHGLDNYDVISSINFTKYYVTQVGGGNTTTDGTASSKTYTKANPNTYLTLSDEHDGKTTSDATTANQMNNLHIAETAAGTMAALENVDDPYQKDEYGNYITDAQGNKVAVEVDGWVHCNNFNAATNANYGGNTFMVNSGSYHFAYINSVDARYHDKYVIIDGATIDESLAGYTYLCFDFDAHGKETTTKIHVKYNIVTGYTTGEDPQPIYKVNDTFVETDLEINGVYHHFHDGVQIAPDLTEAQLVEALSAKLAAGLASTDQIVVDMTSVKYDDYGYGNMYSTGDNVYNDWVIRLINGLVHKGTTAFWEEGYVEPDPDDPGTGGDEPAVTYEKRIMVEDLSVHAENNWEVDKSDWDFNDLVIDVTLDDDGVATMVMQALGGTLPIYISDGTHKTNDLHTYFHVNSTVMVNTGAGVTRDPCSLTDILADFRFLNDENQVDYNSIEILVEINGVEIPMQAPEGKAPSKICVPVTVEWAAERQNIKEKYTDFTEWVSNSSIKFW